ncbi:MAG TPA: class A beta-lactamase [Chthoniobacterales bacterium]
MDVAPRLAALEAKCGGKLGVAALGNGNGQQIGYRQKERFAMCSTFKLLLAAAVLARVDAGNESLDRRVPYRESDLLSYAPITRKHASAGSMSVGELCAAAIQYSDNTAANLLLSTLGGPAGVTHWLRSLGDETTRLDRIEPDLNTNIPGDPRDTTTPAAMVATMQKLLTGDALSVASRTQLARWLIGNTTGDTRLRAGLDPAWIAGDKTGTGDCGAANDVAVIWPKKGAMPWFVVVFVSAPDATPAVRDAEIADVGRIIARAAETK